MPTTSSIANFKQSRTRERDSQLPARKRVRFSEEEQIYKTFQKGTLDIDGENARQSKDFVDRQVLKMGAQTKFPEGSKEQIRVIRAALTSTVSTDTTVLFKTLDTLENNLTNPNAKRKYIDLLSTNPQLRPYSMYWDPYKERIVGIDLKPSLWY